MTSRLAYPVFAIVALALPVAACQTGAATGAAGGAVAGAVVGGPVGAAVGGVAGAAVGGALTAEERTRSRVYIVAQRRPSVRVREQVAVGYRVPARVTLHSVPAEAGLRADYRYTVINERPVLIEPRTRRVVYVYD
jgi:hypothetical protein